MRYSYGSFTLHSVSLHQTQMPSFKLIRLDKVMLRTKNYLHKFSNSRANNSTCSGPITPLIKLI